ncbi:molybdopterin converting factor small subunit [Leucobacter luti]|uniref:Molybdopterin converting factor small subunit n=2 Tax=Leucobacter luti TaxID=340320 RepID=A0A4R6S6M3_9MICO|nr:molybdopterin converting factor small subunit [Leucobacter luti]TDP94446.1 molybdopterin converting factor small subunit [Leucobacter luti]
MPPAGYDGDMASITVRYFAAAAEAAGREEEVWAFPSEATLDELRSALAGRYGDGMLRVLRTGSFLIDGTVRRDGGPIGGGTVDVLPAFAGG